MIRRPLIDTAKMLLPVRATRLELTKDKILVSQLLANESLGQDERVQAFKEQTKKSRATFFRLARQLRRVG